MGKFMKIVARFSFNGGAEFICREYSATYHEVEYVINQIDAKQCKNKVSEEKTMSGRLLFNPRCLNDRFKDEFTKLNWYNKTITCEYKYGEFFEGYAQPKIKGIQPFRDMDFVKDGVPLGVEVQFGKYAFMAYNVCAKMTIFHNLGIINAGIEIVPAKNFADEMSTGVSYFEQIAWDLYMRGPADIDIPVLILGIDT